MYGFSTHRALYAKCPHDPKHEYKERGKCVKEQATKRKRVKHVVSSGEVPHLWFHKVQDSAKNSNGSLYFQGDTIYSYGSHFPIAKHITAGKKSAVLFTTRDYSVTTSGHKSAVRSAIPQGVTVFHVPSVDTLHHTVNLSDYAQRVTDHLAKCARARGSWRKEYEHTRAVDLRNEAREYAKFFGLKLPKIAPIPALDSTGLAKIKESEAKKSAEKAALERARKAKQAIFDAEMLERWRNGEYTGGFHYGVPVALRLTADKTEVETSKGARIPVSHAKRGLRFVRAVIEKKEEYRRNGHTLHLGHYAIDRIEVDGTLYAGCHVISYAEIERLAPALEALKTEDTEKGL